MSARSLASVVVMVVVVATAGAALAQPKPAVPAVVGATEIVTLTTPTGFIDDVAAADGDRFAYVVADSSGKVELRVVAATTRAETHAIDERSEATGSGNPTGSAGRAGGSAPRGIDERSGNPTGSAGRAGGSAPRGIDISGVTPHPLALALVGPRAFVVGTTEDGNQIAALVELAATGKTKPAGSVVYKVPPAAHVTLITRDGMPRIAVHRVAVTASGTRHEIELLALDTGRRIGAARTLELAPGELSKTLDFRVNHWSHGFTRAHGIKGGEWDRRENQRTPDVEATYDLVAGKLVDTKPIEDLFEQRRRFQVLADANGRVDFVRWDGNTLQAWRDGRPHAVELDQPVSSYDPGSLQGVIGSDGSAWLVLKVDPVNPEAVARKKADLEYLDIFRMSSDGKAIRKARVLARGLRHRFGVFGESQFWLLERNQSMDRGGKTLTVYVPG